MLFVRLNPNRILKRYSAFFLGLLGLLVLLYSATGSFAGEPQSPPAPSDNPQIVVLGDSLSAEYGLERGTGWVSLLQANLNKSSHINIINASISGDTTSGGRSRLPILLSKYHPVVVIIELGSNDALRGIPMETSKENLAWMVNAAQTKGSKVLIVGNLVPANYGAALNADLTKMYAQVSKKYKVPLVPFMLKGVADAPNASALFQSDQLHPLAVAHPTILANIWPELKKLL